jgi:hypothetical protein
MSEQKIDLPFGFMTSAYGHNDWSLDKVLAEVDSLEPEYKPQWMELSSIDENSGRASDDNDHTALHVPIKAFMADPTGTARDLAGKFNDRGIHITLGDFDRIHSNHPKQDAAALDYVVRNIDLASALGGRDTGVDVGFFWGYDRTSDLGTNILAVTEKLGVLGAYAESKNVRLLTENCHMPGGWSDEIGMAEDGIRSLGGTLMNRLLVHEILDRDYDLGDVFASIWDPSHGMTEGHPDITVEARLAYAKENVIQHHVKGHTHEGKENLIRMAYTGGHALPGAVARLSGEEGVPNSKLADILAKSKVIPEGIVADHDWNKQYGGVTLPGDGYDITPSKEIFEIARANGFGNDKWNRVIVENETPAKGDAIGANKIGAVTEMYRACTDAIRSELWKGDTYSGKSLPKLVVDDTRIRSLKFPSYAEVKKQLAA